MLCAVVVYLAKVICPDSFADVGPGAVRGDMCRNSGSATSRMWNGSARRSKR